VPRKTKKIKLVIELEYDAHIMHGEDPDGVKWFDSILYGGGLVLHSNEIGDEIGTVRVIKDLARRKD